VKPKVINILGVPYQVAYVKSVSEVDVDGRESLLGQIDYVTSTIRAYDKDRSEAEINHTLLHEILHGLVDNLNLVPFNDNENHSQLDVLSITLADTLTRNGWIK
jgi:hypothetical protein